MKTGAIQCGIGNSFGCQGVCHVLFFFFSHPEASEINSNYQLSVRGCKDWNWSSCWDEIWIYLFWQWICFHGIPGKFNGVLSWAASTCLYHTRDELAQRMYTRVVWAKIQGANSPLFFMPAIDFPTHHPAWLPLISYYNWSFHWICLCANSSTLFRPRDTKFGKGVFTVNQEILVCDLWLSFNKFQKIYTVDTKHFM